jgi:holo-[acyl-carrier protein] synthase
VAVVGVGIDLVDIARFVATLERTPSLRGRVFTDAESLLPPERLAGRFAAKEAVAKALGAPASLQWRDVEVSSLPSGRPVLAVSGSVAAAAEALGIRSWHLSLSHDGGMVTAMVVAES